MGLRSGKNVAESRSSWRRETRLRSALDAINAIRVVGVNLFEGGPGQIAIGGRQDVRYAGAGEFVARLRAPGRLFVPVLDLADAAVPFEDIDVLVGDRLEVHVERRSGEESELLQIDGDQGGAGR